MQVTLPYFICLMFDKPGVLIFLSRYGTYSFDCSIPQTEQPYPASLLSRLPLPHPASRTTFPCCKFSPASPSSKNSLYSCRGPPISPLPHFIAAGLPLDFA